MKHMIIYLTIINAIVSGLSIDLEGGETAKGLKLYFLVLE